LKHRSIALQFGLGIAPTSALRNEFSQFNNRQQVVAKTYSTATFNLELHVRLRNKFALIAGCARYARRSRFDIRIQDNNDPDRSYSFQLNNTTRFWQPYVGMQKTIASGVRAKWVIGYSYGFSFFSLDGKTVVDDFRQGDKTIASLYTVVTGLYELHSVRVQWLYRLNFLDLGVNVQVQRYNRTPVDYSLGLYPQTINAVASYYEASKWQFPSGVICTKYF